MWIINGGGSHYHAKRVLSNTDTAPKGCPISLYMADFLPGLMNNWPRFADRTREELMDVC